MTLSEYKSNVYHRIFIAGYDTSYMPWHIVEKQHYFGRPLETAMPIILEYMDMKRNYGDLLKDRPFDPEDYE